MKLVWSLLIVGGFTGALIAVLKGRIGEAMIFCTIVLFAAIIGRPR